MPEVDAARQTLGLARNLLAVVVSVGREAQQHQMQLLELGVTVEARLQLYHRLGQVVPLPVAGTVDSQHREAHGQGEGHALPVVVAVQLVGHGQIVAVPFVQGVSIDSTDHSVIEGLQERRKEGKTVHEHLRHYSRIKVDFWLVLCQNQARVSHFGLLEHHLPLPWGEGKKLRPILIIDFGVLFGLPRHQPTSAEKLDARLAGLERGVRMLKDPDFLEAGSDSRSKNTAWLKTKLDQLAREDLLPVMQAALDKWTDDTFVAHGFTRDTFTNLTCRLHGLLNEREGLRQAAYVEPPNNDEEFGRRNPDVPG